MRRSEVRDSRGRTLRKHLKSALAFAERARLGEGATLLIYHRVGGGTTDELDLPVDSFVAQMDALAAHDVVSLDEALDCLDAGDVRPTVVLTFDDGFEDVHTNAWPVLRERELPFTLYLASAFVSAEMVWEGSTAKGAAGRGMSWEQLQEMVDSGLCTIGNHTHNHVPPDDLSVDELDACTAAIEEHLGISPKHFTYPWGITVPELEPQLRSRFRSVSTGELGRNQPETDRMRLARVPVRHTDPTSFFSAKLVGSLRPERIYAHMVRTAKRMGLRG